ncbi:TBC1 domain family member 22B [Galdieria sulphuraria]|nr:TBC1 domain family member 22B [Galdieria sulphuraria]
MLNSQSSTVNCSQGPTVRSYANEQVPNKDLYTSFEDHHPEEETKPKLVAIDSATWDNEIHKTPLSGSSEDSQERWSYESASLSNCLSGDLEVARFRNWMEGESFVDIKSLREAAVLGIPVEVRGEVWKFLLNVSKPDRSEELTMRRQMTLEYNELRSKASQDDEMMRRVRNEVKRRTSRNTFRSNSLSKLGEETLQSIFSNIIGAFLASEENFEYDSVLVSILAPFVTVFELNEVDSFYCFQSLMRKHEVVRCMKTQNAAVANFMMLFRTLQPELCEFFESEELEPFDWIPSWIRNLLSRELPMECVLRLWDTYFASEEGLHLHGYVCLAVMDMLQEELLELDGLELKGYLQNLPADSYKDPLV